MKRILLIFVALAAIMPAWADEGMWLLPMMQQLNFKEMKAKGLKLTAEDIYSVNSSSLKDAIVIFGGGCTGEIVSRDGLLFTNHHCGYSAIQALSSVEHDYLKYGFWAADRASEIPAPDITVTFVRHIEDVTAQVLSGVTDGMSEKERREKVTENSRSVVRRSAADYPGMELSVDVFFGGNQYFMFAKEVYKDVRLVGTPPSSIGKFGGETDNWMWPRHTGDFSVFRVYAAPDGVSPAEYSADNVPYHAPEHLKVSLKGYNEGDYSMIMGFPGRTTRFMTSWEVDQMLESENPSRISIREARQDILSEYMAASDEVRIKYAAKYAQSSNYWKNSIGKSRGVRKLGVKAQKEELEARFAAWSEDTEYAPALGLIRDAVHERWEPQARFLILTETFMGSEVLLAAWTLGSPLASAAKGNVAQMDAAKTALAQMSEAFYKDYDPTVDRAASRAMLKIMVDSVPSVLPASLEAHRAHLADYIHDNSVFATREKFDAYLAAGDFSGLADDPAVQLAASVMALRSELNATMTPAAEKFARGHRLLIAGLPLMDAAKPYYPDANSTLRLTYGTILPYSPADAVFYDYKTTLRGVIEKEDPLNPIEFFVPERLKELYHAHDFGPYADRNGDLPTCFISNNDITGGNSGSPVLNARGELIGLAFDGNWDAMSGDVAFEPDLQRTICVDARYVLFVIDKFAGAGYLLNEMSITK